MPLNAAQIAAYQSELSQLRSVLAGAATEVSVDGQRVTYDLDAARKRLRDVQNALYPSLRPRARTIRLGGI